MRAFCFENYINSVKQAQYLVGLCCLSINILQGQLIPERDTTAIVSYADEFVFKLNVDTQTDTYLLRDRLGGPDFRLTPNNNYNLFLSLDYQFIGLSIGFAPTFFNGNNDDDLKGESSFTDFRFRATIGQWVQGFQYAQIKGYYVENTGDYLPGWVEGQDPYLQLNDLTNSSFGMSTSYVFNPNFSLRNVLYQTEWQQKSAGSLIPTLFYSYNTFSVSVNDFKSEEYTIPIRLSLAYYYTWVIEKNWFIAPNIAPSLGLRFSRDKTTSNGTSFTENNTYFTRNLEGGIQLGYASRRVIFGAGFVFDVNWYNEDINTRIRNNKIYGLVYLGYRIRAPKFLTKTYSKLEKKFGL